MRAAGSCRRAGSSPAAHAPSARLVAGLAVALAAGLVAAVGIGGCASDPRAGYSFASSYDRRVQSVAVTVFQNATFYPGLEADLASAIVQRVQAGTPWRVQDADAAQTVLTGTVRDVQLSRLTQDVAGGITQQAAVRLVVDFRWVEAATGRVLAERRGLSVTRTYLPAAGEPTEAGLAQAVTEMASAILESMRSGW
ncbi:MAG: hypothetical protein KatS3mg103_0448 [Phycisphaerales bacterium]|nr:MAG: hypothetical protein KatS3mg103_0448 [Phycisphaerales bacterium]